MPTITASFGLAHKNAKPSDKSLSINWVSAPEKSPNISSPWNKTETTDNTLSITYGGYLYTDNHIKLSWGKFNQLDDSLKIIYGGLVYVDDQTRLVFTDFAQHADNSYSIKYHQRLQFIDKQSKGAWGKFAIQDKHYLMPWGGHIAVDKHTRIVWDSVWTAKREVVIDTSPVVFPTGFGQIPTNKIQQVYFIMHSLAVVVLPSRTSIEATSLSLSIDIDSFAWLLNMQVAEGIALIRPDINGVKEVEINIDGYIWEFIIESYTENKEFNNNTWSVTGRSKTAYLTAPYKLPVSTTYGSQLLASQLIDTELSGSGFTFTYSTVDWLVNANAFSYQNLTAMQAIRRVADAVGGVILPHQTDNSLIINPRYQSSPWDWGTATPVASLTSDIIMLMSGNWQPKADINGVYVGGNTLGVECFVKRVGTAGDQLSTQYTDNLITHQDAGREKGRNILSDRGKQEVVSVELPVLPLGETPAIYQCGDLVEINEGAQGVWRGIVLGISISANVSDGAISASQTVSLEKHYGEY